MVSRSNIAWPTALHSQVLLNIIRDYRMNSTCSRYGCFYVIKSRRTTFFAPDFRILVSFFRPLQVIWRKQPYNVPITVGLEQFLEINRFYLSHVPHRDTWDLLIKNVQPFDAGTYECQIASTEKLLRRNITLYVTGKFQWFFPRKFLSQLD